MNDSNTDRRTSPVDRDQELRAPAIMASEAKMSVRRRQPGVSVASKIMRVLDAFSSDQAELGPSEISRRSGLPYATAHRLVAELVRVGALDRSSGGKYSIGLRLWEIGSSTPHLMKLRNAVIPYIQPLRAGSGPPHIHLNVLHGTQGLRLKKTPDRAALLASTEDLRFPLHATSGGQVLLAYAEVDRMERVLAGPLARWTRHTITAPDQLRQILAEIHRSGVAISSEQYRRGIADVAAPVFGTDGAAIASIEIVMSASEQPRQHILALRAAAAELSWTLRGSSPSRRAASSSGNGCLTTEPA